MILSPGKKKFKKNTVFAAKNKKKIGLKTEIFIPKIFVCFFKNKLLITSPKMKMVK